MEHSDRPGLPRAAVIVGHPLHSLLVVFRLGFLMGALATGLIFWGVTDSFLARVLVLLLSTGVAMGVLVGMARLIEFFAVNPITATIFSKRCSMNNR